MTANSRDSLGSAEQEAIGYLRKELKEHLELTERAFNLIGTVVQSSSGRPINSLKPSLLVSTLLLNRISNDLRCCAFLAVRGYPVQALSLVASIYEAAWTAAYIGADDVLAQEWIEHADPTRLFRDALTLTKGGIRKLTANNHEQQASIEYRVYRQLCMAKHANPLFQTRHGLEATKGSLVLSNGPQLTEEANRGSWFALEHAVGYTCVAVHSFVVSHRAAQPDLIAQLNELGRGRKTLEGKAQQRWGNVDPFPGKWRVGVREGTENKGALDTTDRRQIYGVDFSGARRACRGIWIAKGQIEEGALHIVSCQSAANLLGCSSERDACLAALRECISKKNKAIVAMDFPFGLPRPLVKGKSWVGFVESFKRRFPTAEKFKEACLKASQGKELKRCTDTQAHTPFSPYNLRLYRQTYYGISALLAPLVTKGEACVLPMQEAHLGKPWLIEICPASWLKKRGLGGIAYKGRSSEHRASRRRLIEHVAETAKLRLAPVASQAALDNSGGDALDSIIAACAAFEAYYTGLWKPSHCVNEAGVEGYVYF